MSSLFLKLSGNGNIIEGYTVNVFRVESICLANADFKNMSLNIGVENDPYFPWEPYYG